MTFDEFVTMAFTLGALQIAISALIIFLTIKDRRSNQP